LRYPDGRHDSEALLVHPKTGRIYLVVKEKSARPGIYAADAPKVAGDVVSLARIGEVDMSGQEGGLINGGAIAPDGQRAALSDYDQGYEFVLPNANASFDSIWKQPMQTVDLGLRKHGETITYRLDGKALLATSERLPTPLIQAERRESGKWFALLRLFRIHSRPNPIDRQPKRDQKASGQWRITRQNSQPGKHLPMHDQSEAV
jgi:hypothetical protein